MPTGSSHISGLETREGHAFQNPHSLGSIQDHLDHYRSYLTESGLSKNTIRYYTRDINQYIEWVKALPVDPSCNGAELAALYTKHLQQSAYKLRPDSIGKYSPSTIMRKLYALRRFFDHLLANRFVPTNPFREFTAHIPQLTFSPREEVTLSIETIREIIATCDLSKPIGLRDRALLLCILAFGLRVGEIRRLNESNIHLDEGYLEVTERNNNARIVPLFDIPASSLKMWLVVRSLYTNSCSALFVSLHHSTGRGEPGLRLTKRGIRSIVDGRLEMVGAKQPGVSCEVVRRSAIIHSLANGAPLEDIRSMFGVSPKAMRAYKEYVSEIT